MALIALCSFKGAPGVTTTVLALTMSWPAPVVMVEADPTGGDVRAGYLRGEMVPAHDLVDLAAQVRRDPTPEGLWPLVIALHEVRPAFLLPGFADPATQAPAVAAAWEPIARALSNLTYRSGPVDVVVDCGRLGHPHAPAPLLTAADLVVVVAKNSLSGITALHRHLPALRDQLQGHQTAGAPTGLCVLTIGHKHRETGGASAGDLAAMLRCPVGTLVRAPNAARVISDGAPAIGHDREDTAYLRSIRAASEGLKGAAPSGEPTTSRWWEVSHV